MKYKASHVRSDQAANSAEEIDQINQHVGQRIRQRRRDLNLARRDLARRIGVTTRALDGLESGVRRIGPVHLVSLSLALGVDIDYFFADLPRADSVDSISEIHLDNAEYRAFVEAYFAIANPDTRRDFFRLVRAVAARY